MQLTSDEPLAVSVTRALRVGDLDALSRLLDEHPDLASATILSDDGMARSMLHIATDWPGHFPNNAKSVRVLIDAGADVNARFSGSHTETALHWAASSDDVDVVDALLDAGADIEADGAVIGGGTALTDATAFGQWRAARRLIERGARSTLFESAAMGLLDRVTADLGADTPPSPGEISWAFWGACHGGQPMVANYLLERGADINWVAPWDGLTPLDAARRSEHSTMIEWLRERGAQPAMP
jgi:ankyrin repeat protein